MEEPRRDQGDLRMDRGGAKKAQAAIKESQGGPKEGQREPKDSKETAKEGPRRPKGGPRRAKQGPRKVQGGTKEEQRRAQGGFEEAPKPNASREADRRASVRRQKGCAKIIAKKRCLGPSTEGPQPKYQSLSEVAVQVKCGSRNGTPALPWA